MAKSVMQGDAKKLNPQGGAFYCHTQASKTNWPLNAKIRGLIRRAFKERRMNKRQFPATLLFLILQRVVLYSLHSNVAIGSTRILTHKLCTVHRERSSTNAPVDADSGGVRAHFSYRFFRVCGNTTTWEKGSRQATLEGSPFLLYSTLPVLLSQAKENGKVESRKVTLIGIHRPPSLGAGGPFTYSRWSGKHGASISRLEVFSFLLTPSLY